MVLSPFGVVSEIIFPDALQNEKHFFFLSVLNFGQVLPAYRQYPFLGLKNNIGVPPKK